MSRIECRDRGETEKSWSICDGRTDDSMSRDGDPSEKPNLVFTDRWRFGSFWCLGRDVFSIYPLHDFSRDSFLKDPVSTDYLSS